MTPERLKELRAIAEAATQGEWKWSKNKIFDCLEGDNGQDLLFYTNNEDGIFATRKEDGTYITTFDPPTVITMLDKLEELQSSSITLPAYEHRKTGRLYAKCCEARLENDLTPVIVYRGEDGEYWVRPKSEFEDGRFKELDEKITLTL